MNLYRVLYAATLVMSLNTSLSAMKQVPISDDCDSLRNFSITFCDTNNQQKTFYFCEYDFETISEQDQKGYLELYDYEGVLNTLNSVTQAEHFSRLASEQPEKFMEGARNRQRNRRIKLLGKHEVGYAWFVKEIDEQGHEQIIAQVRVGTYGGDKPEKYADANLFEVGITGHKSYRGQRYATRLIPLVMEHLAKHQEFQDVYFCYRTESTNTVTHKLALSFGFELAMSTAQEVDLGSSTVIVQTDLFVLSSPEAILSKLEGV